MDKAVFLDRDGTLNVEVDYLHETDKLVFIDGTFQALRLLKAHAYKLIVISNQSGIGRGYYKKQDVEQLHHYMNAILSRHDAEIDAFYYCPHVEQDECLCRKPHTGLIDRAVAEWKIDLGQSYMVGDKESDLMTAFNAGCKYALVLSGHPVSEILQDKYKKCLFKNLWDFAQHICICED